MTGIIKKYYIEKQYKKCTGINNTTYPKTLTMYSFTLSLKKIHTDYTVYLIILSTLLTNLKEKRIHGTIWAVLTLLVYSHFAVTLITLALPLTKEAKPLVLTF